MVAYEPFTGHQKWTATVPGASSVALLGTDDAGVVFMAAGMSGAALYTADGSTNVTKVTALNPQEITAFSGAKGTDAPQAVRVGGYLAVAFPSAGLKNGRRYWASCG